MEKKIVLFGKLSIVVLLFLCFSANVFAVNCSWTETSLAGEDFFSKLLKGPDGTLYALGATGSLYGLYKSTDNGGSWQKIDGYSNYIADFLKSGSGYDVIVTPSNHLYAAGYVFGVNPSRALVFYSTDGGSTWNPTNNLGEVGSIILLEANGKIFAGTNKDATVFKNTPGQANWTQLTQIPNGNITYNMFKLNTGEIYQVMSDDASVEKIYKTSDEGTTWDFVGDIPSEAYVTSIVQLSSGALLFASIKEIDMVTHQGTVYGSGDLGENWSLLKTFEAMDSANKIVQATNGIIYLGASDYSSFGKMFRSKDLGETWEEIPNSINAPHLGFGAVETADNAILVTDGGLGGAWKLQCTYTAPVANAGADQTMETGSIVQLNGSASSDPDGDVLTFTWSQISGTTVTLNNENIVNPTFTAPAAAGSLVFKVTVADGMFKTEDTVQVTVEMEAECDEGTKTDCTTNAGCAGKKTCTNGVWESCNAETICNAGSARSCNPVINGVECAGITGTQACNACGSAYSECTAPSGIECCTGQIEECEIEDCNGGKVCSQLGNWGECVKEDPECGAEEQSECTTNADCEENEKCENEKCVALECAENKTAENHECAEKTGEESQESTLDEASAAINAGDAEKAKEKINEMKSALASSEKYDSVKPLLNQALGEIESGDFAGAQETIGKIKELLKPGIGTGTIDYMSYLPIIAGAGILIVLGLVILFYLKIRK